MLQLNFKRDLKLTCTNNFYFIIDPSENKKKSEIILKYFLSSVLKMKSFKGQMDR